MAVAAMSDEQAEAVVFALSSRGFRLTQVLEHEVVGRLATVCMVAPGKGAPVLVDLLFHSSGIEPEIAVSAEPVEIWGHRVAGARLGHLVALTLVSVSSERPRDQSDLVALRLGATGEDLRLAREAVQLITNRGCDRGRDLEAALASWWGPPGA